MIPLPGRNRFRQRSQTAIPLSRRAEDAKAAARPAAAGHIARRLVAATNGPHVLPPPASPPPHPPPPPLPSLQPVPTPTACSSPHALSMSPHHCFAAAAAATTTPAMAAAAATGSAGISSAPAFRLLGSGSCSVPAQLRLPPAAAAAAATSRRRSLLRCAASSGGDAGGGSDSDPALEEQKRRQAELAARIASGEFTVQGPGLARGAPARPTFCSSSSHSPPPRVD